MPSTSEERARVEVEREEDAETVAGRDEHDLERKVLVLWHLPPGIRRQEVQVWSLSSTRREISSSQNRKH